MPVHSHLRDLVTTRFTEHRPSGLNPFSGTATTENGFEFCREPGANTEDLARGHGDLRLIVGHIDPPPSDGILANARLGERRLDEHGLVVEHRHDLLHICTRPAFGKPIHQFPTEVSDVRLSHIGVE